MKSDGNDRNEWNDKNDMIEKQTNIFTDQKKERNQIRSGYKHQREAMSASLVRQLSSRICDQILAWELYQQADMIFFYYPLGNEVSLLSVMEHALRSGKRIALPKTGAVRMDFYEVFDLHALQEGRFHVMEPESNEKAPIDQLPELCFVPGVVFDRAGGRFGYGKGYYDRYFADRDSVKLAGCAYECQIAERLPVHEWDVRMDYLVSERSIESCKVKNPFFFDNYMVEREKSQKNV